MFMSPESINLVRLVWYQKRESLVNIMCLLNLAHIELHKVIWI